MNTFPAIGHKNRAKASGCFNSSLRLFYECHLEMFIARREPLLLALEYPLCQYVYLCLYIHVRCDEFHEVFVIVFVSSFNGHRTSIL